MDSRRFAAGDLDGQVEYDFIANGKASLVRHCLGSLVIWPDLQWLIGFPNLIYDFFSASWSLHCY